MFNDINSFSSDITDAAFEKVLQELDIGRNVDAIRYLRDHQGLGPKDAKTAVEDILSCRFLKKEEMN